MLPRRAQSTAGRGVAITRAPHARNARLKADSTILGDVCTELGVLLDSGVDVARALSILEKNDDAAVARTAARVRVMVESGVAFARAGQRAGLLRGLDVEIVQAGEQAGHLGAVLHRLAGWHEARAARARLIKSRMLLPTGVFLLALFVAPLPALVAGTISGAEYLLGIITMVLQVAVAAWLLWKFPGWLRARGEEKSNVFDRLRLRAPFFGELHQRREVLQVLESFELLYSAGVPPLQALQLAKDSATNGHVRERFEQAHAQLQQGLPLADAFNASGMLSASANQLLLTGDASGRLTEMLRRVSAVERDELRAIDEQIAAWVPRLVYALVALWMTRQILGANLLGA